MCAADAAPEDALWAVARFGVRCSTRHLSAYLADARALTLTLEDRFGGMLGEAAVPLAALAVAAKSGSGAGAPVSADVRFVAQHGGAAEAPDMEGCPVAHAALQMRIAYPAAGFAATPRSAALPLPGSAVEPDLAFGEGPPYARSAMAPQHDMAGPEEPRQRDALPAPVAWDDAGSTGGAPDSGSGGEAFAERARGHAVAELQGDFGAPDAGPPGVWWAGELRGWQAQPPGEPRAWPFGAYLGAVPAAYLAAWQAQAQAQGDPWVPPAWSRQAPPAQPVFVPPWPAYAPQAWLAPPSPPAPNPGSKPLGLGQGHAAAPVSAAGAAQGIVTQGLGAASAGAGGSGGGSGNPGKGPTRRRRAGSAGTGRTAGAPLDGTPGGRGMRGGLRAGRSAAAAEAAGDASSSDSSAGGHAAASAVGNGGKAAETLPVSVGAPGRLKRARKA